MVIVYKKAESFIESAKLFAVKDTLYFYGDKKSSYAQLRYIAFFDSQGNLHRGEFISTALTDPSNVKVDGDRIYYELDDIQVNLEEYTPDAESDLQKHKNKISQLLSVAISWEECLGELSHYTYLDVETIQV